MVGWMLGIVETSECQIICSWGQEGKMNNSFVGLGGRICLWLFVESTEGHSSLA